MARKETDLASALSDVVAQLDAGEARPGQLAMATAVAAAFEAGDLVPRTGAPGALQRRHLAVAAGTGTGKSLGYLVPAVLSRKRVVVATATKALQDQLSTKDLPLVAAGLRRPFKWAVLKGRANYLCRQRLAEIEHLGEQEKMDLGSTLPSAAVTAGSAPGEQVARIVAWSAETKSGDRAELGFEPDQSAWSSVSVTADECPGAHRCPSGERCFAERARSKAAEAEVVVVNHHLLGAHLRSDGAVLPEHDALVVDEAHDLEDIIAASLGVEISAGRLRGVAAAARGALTATGEKTAGAVDDVFDAAALLDAMLKATGEVRLRDGLGSELGPAVAVCGARLQRLESELRAASGGASGLSGASVAPEASQRSIRALLSVERLREELTLCAQAGEETVVWVQGGDRPSLRSAPLDVSAQLSDHVFSEMPVVLTSATMTPGLAVRLGAEPVEVKEIDVGSPFDFQSNALLYCAVDLPERRQPGAEEKLHDELEELILAAGGRTLALFTSHRSMQLAAAALRARVPWPVHLQGDLPKSALVAAFAAEEESCLFATMGFWQGVDVPGATLSLVVLDKIPFPRPDDPLIAARREAAGSQGFRQVDLPRAATRLAQGAGRLIRSATDRGVVAVLDPRLARASYSGYLVAGLPKMRRTRDRQVALCFLRSLHADPPPSEPEAQVAVAAPDGSS